MKRITHIKYQGRTLTVLVEEKESTKGYVLYFIDGLEVLDWGTLTTDFQDKFNTLAGILCSAMDVQKWSY